MRRSLWYCLGGKPNNHADIAHWASKNGCSAELRVERSNGDNEYKYHIIVRANGKDVHTLHTKLPETKYRNYLPASEPNKGVEMDILFRLYTMTELLQKDGITVEIDRESLEEHLTYFDDMTKFLGKFPL